MVDYKSPVALCAARQSRVLDADGMITMTVNSIDANGRILNTFTHLHRGYGWDRLDGRDLDALEDLFRRLVLHILLKMFGSGMVVYINTYHTIRIDIPQATGKVVSIKVNQKR